MGILLFALLPSLAAQPDDARSKVDSIFTQYRTGSPGCTVGVAVKGATVLERAYGMADLEHDLALTPESVLEAGSVSKQFTAAAILLLAQSGKLSLDEPARRYLPELHDSASTVTIRQMIHHTSGLRDWGAVAAIGGTPRTSLTFTFDHLLDIMSRQKALNYAPGAAYSYSNSGYSLGAVLVARVSGKSFGEFTRENIFEPLGMSSTEWRADHRKIVRRRAIAYAPATAGFLQNMPFEDVHGNGGLLTTVGDLLRWNHNFTTKAVGGGELHDV